MTTNTHLAIGAAVTAGICAAVSADAVFAAAACVASLPGSRAPDWDIKLEKVRRLLAHVIRPLRRRRVHHRGPTHYLVSWVLVTAASAAGAFAVYPEAALPVLTGVGCGYLAHLLADACTIRGVPLRGPWNRRCVHLLPVRLWIVTGKRADRLIGLVATLAAVGFVFVLSDGMSYT